MIILVRGRLGNITVEPERAVVEVGDHVEWSIEVNGWHRKSPGASVTWEIYFGQETPFSRHNWRVETEVKLPRRKRWRDKNKVAYVATIEAGEANGPGEYKYGVRAFSDSPGAPISDDDPYLIVRPRR